MDNSFKKSVNTTDEWYTPRYIVESLGPFDLDPCAPLVPIYRTATTTMYNKEDNGLIQEWQGRVWLNPPYSRPLIDKFVNKLAEHGNGIALPFNRCDTQLFQKTIFEKADAIMFLSGRVKFLRPDGDNAGTPGTGSVLIAFGELNSELLKFSGLDGKFIKLK